MTAATNTGPFMELGVTMCTPSGDHLQRRQSRYYSRIESKTHERRVRFVLGEFLNGSLMLAWRPQSSVRQILTVLSSDCQQCGQTIVVGSRERREAHLGREKLSDRIKDNSLDESHVSIQSTHEFCSHASQSKTIAWSNGRERTERSSRPDEDGTVETDTREVRVVRTPRDSCDVYHCAHDVSIDWTRGGE